jgi:aminoglycoside phosphotransferase (APT) family kinase protein
VPEVTDAADPNAVGEAFRRWAADRFGGAVVLAEPATSTGEGFDTRIVFAQLSGEVLPANWRAPLVLRIQPSVDRIGLARREADVQNWCAAGGYPAPRVLAVIEPGDMLELPVQVMERAPGTTMLTSMTARPWRVPGLVRRLADLEVRLHGLATEGWPGHGGDVSLADRRLAFPRLMVPQLDDARLSSALATAEEIAAALADAPTVVCHGDLHPLNVMVDGRASAVIDWTDAALGDRHGDVSRTALLFLVGAIAAENAVERMVLRALGPVLRRMFLRSYMRGSPTPIDADRLRRWEALHCVHGWTQVAALHAGLLDDDTKPDENRQRVSPALADWLAARFARAAA